MTRRVPKTEAVSEPEQSGSPAGTVPGKRICEKISGNQYGDPLPALTEERSLTADNQGGTAMNMSSLERDGIFVERRKPYGTTTI